MLTQARPVLSAPVPEYNECNSKSIIQTPDETLKLIGQFIKLTQVCARISSDKTATRAKAQGGLRFGLRRSANKWHDTTFKRRPSAFCCVSKRHQLKLSSVCISSRETILTIALRSSGDYFAGGRTQWSDLVF